MPRPGLRHHAGQAHTRAVGQAAAHGHHVVELEVLPVGDGHPKQHRGRVLRPEHATHRVDR
jgi:hypothetical protein